MNYIPTKARSAALGSDVREVRVRALGRDWLVRFNSFDPNWRARALADVEPLSEAAFTIRRVPLTDAERIALANVADPEARATLADIVEDAGRVVSLCGRAAR